MKCPFCQSDKAKTIVFRHKEFGACGACGAGWSGDEESGYSMLHFHERVRATGKTVMISSTPDGGESEFFSRFKAGKL